ncbi:MAG: hypothetical protein ACYDCL_05910 [Myxococcales bacterium]
MRSAAAAAVLALAACTCREPSPDAGSLAFSELGPEVAGAACACLLRADAGSPPYCNLADCEAAFPQLGLSTLAAEIDAGLLAYDGHAAASCLADAGAFRCPYEVLLPPSIALLLSENCPGALVASRGAGQICLTSFDCDAGVCVQDAGGCAGVCTPPLPAGAACNVAGVPCAGTLTCLGGRCAGPPQAGAPCRSLGESGDCGPLLWCDLDAGACVSRASHGEICQWQGGALAPPCQAPGWCSQWSGVGSCRLPSDAGGPCLTLDDANDCVPPLTCLPADAGPGFGVCGPRVGDGGICGGFGCETDLVCEQGRCIPPPGSGEPCFWLGVPLNGLTVLDACAGSLACGLYWDAGSFCGSPACLGESCATGENACADGLCAGGRCTVPALGSPCRGDLDCVTGLCLDGGCADPYACAP